MSARTLTSLCCLAIAVASPRPVRADDDVATFLHQHWAPLPAAAINDAVEWGALESRLDPQSCGACHPSQLAAWTGSRHAAAMSAGVQMQLLDAPRANDGCNDCHAPLIEQRPAPGGAADNPSFRADLQSAGLTCPSCHVRQGRLYGPTRPTERPPLPPPLPHGGFSEQAAFEDSRFCATCHQFSPEGYRLGGVLLEDTWAEWQKSPAGRAGEPCQSCHMPDRRHLWRGVHDPETTQAALDFSLVQTGKRRARYSVTNVRVGHRFPTYVSPRVSLVLEGRDASGQVVAQHTWIVQRAVDLSLNTQRFDTRLAPGETAAVELRWTRAEDVKTVAAFTFVEPDYFYARFYHAYKASTPQSEALRQLAITQAADSSYTIGSREFRP